MLKNISVEVSVQAKIHLAACLTCTNRPKICLMVYRKVSCTGCIWLIFLFGLYLPSRMSVSLCVKGEKYRLNWGIDPFSLYWCTFEGKPLLFPEAYAGLKVTAVCGGALFHVGVHAEEYRVVVRVLEADDVHVRAERYLVYEVQL